MAWSDIVTYCTCNPMSKASNTCKLWGTCKSAYLLGVQLGEHGEGESPSVEASGEAHGSLVRVHLQGGHRIVLSLLSYRVKKPFTHTTRLMLCKTSKKDMPEVNRGSSPKLR